MFLKKKKMSDGKEILTINQRRWRKFKSFKRGYYSLLLLISLYIASFALPLFINSKPIVVSHEGNFYFPAFKSFAKLLPLIGDWFPSDFYSGESFGQVGITSECDYRVLDGQYKSANGEDFLIMPLYPFDPLETSVSTPGVESFIAPFESDAVGFHLLGTDDSGRDVFARMAYGFQVSLSFALILAFFEYLVAIPLGATLGYFGGWYDTILQRIIEIWTTVPFLFLIIIVVSIFKPSFILLLTLLFLFGWMGITLLMRAEFYREKAKDYVAAAISIGVPTRSILLKHILPNALVPVITYLPFAIVGGITALVSLDFLGFGLPPPTPSWGQMIGAGLGYISTGKWWLVVVPFSALFLTLTLVVFIGEGVREGYDPKVFSRLR